MSSRHPRPCKVYEEDHHNCYGYALAFINCVLATEGEEQLDRDEFTEKLVVPEDEEGFQVHHALPCDRRAGFYVTDPLVPRWAHAREVACAGLCGRFVRADGTGRGVWGFLPGTDARFSTCLKPWLIKKVTAFLSACFSLLQ